MRNCINLNFADIFVVVKSGHKSLISGSKCSLKIQLFCEAVEKYCLPHMHVLS